ncbi:MAG: hypothetical protein R3C19_24500 [Planctomycetaceae bacterium]
MVKPRLRDDATRATAQRVLVVVTDHLLLTAASVCSVHYRRTVAHAESACSRARPATAGCRG